ncbi:MAG: chitobiase/beta-hexosaminidase C-terminal domain-containing protein, partial [Bacteroidales bacterium]|nr:chitobiase/beta-hexosaminidase C-terminal domain-containing protein [Candidatus Sodaliphilus aphodohippi]
AFSTDGLSVIATYSDNSNETITEGIEWTVDPETFTAAGENVTVQVLAGYNNLTSDIAEYTVTVEEAPAPGGNDFTLVTSTSDLVAGREYIIINQEKAVAMSTTQNGNNRGQTAVELSSDKNTATINDDAQVFTLEGSSSGWYFNTGAGYIYAASSSSNYLRTETTKDDNAKAAITFSDNTASIVFQGNYTRNVLQYNSSNSIFSCYSSASQKPVYLYYRNAGPAKTMTSIAISGTPTTTTYTVGEAFSTAGLSVIATYSDNSTETITDGIEWEIDPTTFDTAGENVTVSVMAGYNNLTSDIAEYTVTVNAPVTMTSIAISGTPTTTTYTVGEAFSTAGLSIIATYSDNSNETITDGIEWTVDPETFTAAGENVTVQVLASYNNLTSDIAEYTVTVNAPVTITSIAISGTPSKLTYKVGDAFDTDDLIATATYSDGTQGDVTEHTTWTVSPETFTEAGENINVSVIATYEGVTSEPANYTVTVEEKQDGGLLGMIVWDDNGSDASAAVTSNSLPPYTTQGMELVDSYSGISKVYQGTTGLKFGSGSAIGTLTINLKESVNASKIVLNAKQYGSGDGGTFKVTVNGQSYTIGALTGDLTDYEIELDGTAITSLTIQTTSKRAYLKSVAFYGQGGEPTVATPVITPNGGKFDGEQEVTITCETADVTIYYTTDGTEPTSDSELYTGPFTINESCTVKAIAVDADDNASDVASADFISSQLTHVKNIAEFLALPDGTDAIFDNPVTVLYDYSQHSKTGQEYIWIKDGSAYTQLFVTPQFDEDFIAKYVNGDVIPAGFVATKNFYDTGKYYQGLVNDENGKATFQDATTKALADPELITFDEFSSINANDDTDLANWNNRYVLLKNVKFSSKDNYNSYISNGTTGTRAGSNVAYNKFNVTVPNEDNVAYNVYAIIQKWNSVWEILPIAFEPYAEQTLTLKELVTKGNAGETDTETTYTIGNSLQVVTTLTDKVSGQTILLMKDDNGQTVNPTSKGDNEDYLIKATSVFTDNSDVEEVNAKTQTDYDQSNWLEVVVPATMDTEALTNAIIAGGNISGKYVNTVNPRLVLDNDVTLAASTTTDAYYRNAMCPANFNGSQEGYYFVTPKPNEYVQVVWAVYCDGFFYMPTISNPNAIAGKLAINSFNYNVEQSPALVNYTAYQFTAIAKQPETASQNAPRKAMGTTFDIQPCSTVGTMQINPINLQHNDNIVTGVDGVNSSKAVESVKFFNLQGAEFGEMQPGVNIMVIKFTDGTTLSSKVIK